MGKIVKYCSACEEGFAEKFGFCPNCGSSLTAFEMNPLAGQNSGTGDSFPDQAKGPVSASETNQPVANNFDRETGEPGGFANEAEKAGSADFSSPNENIQEIEVEGGAKNFEESNYPKAAAYSAGGSFAGEQADEYDEDFHVTVIEEKNVGQRNLLLLGSTILILTLAMSGVVYSLFTKEMNLAAIDINELPVYVDLGAEPMAVDEPEKPKANDDEGGGGGGGGREELQETNKGRLADQMEAPPLIPPTKTIIQRDNPELVQKATTVGNKKFDQTEEPYGNPNSKSTFLSDGQGSGGGQGSGVGTGQGSGRGTGAGSGIGSGFGSGVGDGEGGGRGSGTGVSTPPKPPEPKPSGPSKSLQITYKPKPRYTDEARQKNIQGTVTLRVTFLSSGAIGSVSPVSSLGYGLTEQAIAAAKQIRFEPELVNGQPRTVVKSVQFSFTIY